MHDPSDLVSDRDAWVRALGTLSESDRETLMLVAWEGLDNTDAASALGCSAAAFRVRLHRARSRLEAAVAGTQDEPSGQEASP